jgi:ligand-binding SRPBCC domain-containing protein
VKRLVFEKTIRIAAPREAVFRFFSHPDNLVRITPDALHFHVLCGPDRTLQEGDLLEYGFRIFGLPIRWTSRIASWRENESFSDFQERGPYAYWLHTHTFRDADGGTELNDRVEYALRLGFLGRLLTSALVRRELQRIFNHRAAAIESLLTAAG